MPLYPESVSAGQFIIVGAAVTYERSQQTQLRKFYSSDTFTAL